MGKADFEFTELGRLGKSIAVQEMKGNDTVYFRLTKMYKDDAGNWHPTNKGVSVPASEAQNLMAYLKDFIAKNSSDTESADLASDLKDL